MRPDTPGEAFFVPNRGRTPGLDPLRLYFTPPARNRACGIGSHELDAGARYWVTLRGRRSCARHSECGRGRKAPGVGWQTHRFARVRGERSGRGTSGVGEGLIETPAFLLFNFFHLRRLEDFAAVEAFHVLGVFVLRD